MDARWGWALAALAVASGGWQWGWRGVLLAGTVVVFWLLLQFGRALRGVQQAGKAPMGTVASAVMLHSRLNTGMTLLQILPLTGSLGDPVSTDPETFAWRDAAGDRVVVVLQGGKVTSWQLHRAGGGSDGGGAGGQGDATS